MASTLYQNLPLPAASRCIRILDIRASAVPNDQGEPIESDLRVVDLDHGPTFTALSYAWGQQEIGNFTIKCGSVCIAVSDNCYHALKHLRRKLGNLSLWIDAISINQDDRAEKSEQIPLMGAIYRSATTVYIWLGPGTLRTDRALAFLQNAGFQQQYSSQGSCLVWRAICSAYFMRWSTSLRRSIATQLGSIDRREGTTITRDPDHPDGFVVVASSDVLELLTRDWVQRIWTYQELLFATKPVIVCGDVHLDWDRFVIGILFINNTRLFLAQRTNTSTWLATWTKLIFSRARWQDTTASPIVQGQLSEVSKLRTYQAFVRLLAKRYLVLRKIAARIFVGCSVVLGCGAFFTLVLSRVRGGFFSYMLILLLVPIALILALGFTSTRFRRRAPFPALDFYVSPISRFQSAVDEQDDMISVLCTRQATDPKDMAFGLHSILQAKLGAILPMPDYALSQHEIFRTLTLNVLIATNSLDFLVLASLKPYTNSTNTSCTESSWVPDWSTEYPRFWTQPPFQRTPIRAAAGPSKVDSIVNSISPDSLSVRGRQVGTVDRWSQFQQTADTYTDADRASHLHNLSLMLDLVRCHFYAISVSSDHGQLSPDLNDLFADSTSPFRRPVNISRMDFTTYVYMLIVNRRKSAGEVLFRLLHGPPVQEPWPRKRFRFIMKHSPMEILVIHIAICNQVAKSGVRLFTTKDMVPLRFLFSAIGQNPRDGFVPFQTENAKTTLVAETIGVCTDKVKQGDLIMLISGLSLPLIVRRRPGTDFCISLVSPAVVIGIMQGQAWFKSKQDELENTQMFEIISHS